MVQKLKSKLLLKSANKKIIIYFYYQYPEAWWPIGTAASLPADKLKDRGFKFWEIFMATPFSRRVENLSALAGSPICLT